MYVVWCVSGGVVFNVYNSSYVHISFISFLKKIRL